MSIYRPDDTYCTQYAVQYSVRLFYGCSYMFHLTCPAITVGTVISLVLARPTTTAKSP